VNHCLFDFHLGVTYTSCNMKQQHFKVVHVSLHKEC